VERFGDDAPRSAREPSTHSGLPLRSRYFPHDVEDLQSEALELVAHQARRHLLAQLDEDLNDSLLEALRTRRLDPAGVAREILSHGLHSRP
jgi:hypothetical protein